MIDVIFEIFIVVGCVTAIGGCCIPCINACAEPVADHVQEEAVSKEDIKQLPKYRYKRVSKLVKKDGDNEESNVGGTMTRYDADTHIQHVLPLDYAACCICLCAYQDGTELRQLPCLYHFHSYCIDKWLSTNAICPLCKYKILKNCRQVENSVSHAALSFS